MTNKMNNSFAGLVTRFCFLISVQIPRTFLVNCSKWTCISLWHVVCYCHILFIIIIMFVCLYMFCWNISMFTWNNVNILYGIQKQDSCKVIIKYFFRQYETTGWLRTLLATMLHENTAMDGNNNSKYFLYLKSKIN